MHTADDEAKKGTEMCECNKGLVIGYRDLELKSGEELRILCGIEMEVPPAKVIVLQELPQMILLELTFIKGYYSPISRGSRTYRICVHKGALLCGDVILLRLADKQILAREAVAKYVDTEDGC